MAQELSRRLAFGTGSTFHLSLASIVLNAALTLACHQYTARVYSDSDPATCNIFDWRNVCVPIINTSYWVSSDVAKALAHLRSSAFPSLFAPRLITPAHLHEHTHYCIPPIRRSLCFESSTDRTHRH